MQQRGIFRSALSLLETTTTPEWVRDQMMREPDALLSCGLSTWRLQLVRIAAAVPGGVLSTLESESYHTLTFFSIITPARSFTQYPKSGSSSVNDLLMLIQ